MRSTYRVGAGKESKFSRFEVTVKGAPKGRFDSGEVLFHGASNHQHSGLDDCLNYIKTLDPTKTYLITEYPKAWDKYAGDYRTDLKNITLTEI
jgi:hypothetical protein